MRISNLLISGYVCIFVWRGLVLCFPSFQDFVAQIQESVVFSILSERRIGPHLYAVFRGGRLEEYLPVSFDSSALK